MLLIKSVSELGVNEYAIIYYFLYVTLAWLKTLLSAHTGTCDVRPHVFDM